MCRTDDPIAAKCPSRRFARKLIPSATPNRLRNSCIIGRSDQQIKPHSDPRAPFGDAFARACASRLLAGRTIGSPGRHILSGIGKTPNHVRFDLRRERRERLSRCRGFSLIGERNGAIGTCAPDQIRFDQHVQNNQQLARIHIPEQSVCRKRAKLGIVRLPRKHVCQIADRCMYLGMPAARGGAQTFAQDVMQRFGRELRFRAIARAKRHCHANVAVPAISRPTRFGAAKIAENEFCSAFIAVYIMEQ